MYADVLTIKDSSFIVNGKSELFKEHFPNFPILPGAFGLGYSIDNLIRILSKKYKKIFELKLIKKVNFVKSVEPGVMLSLKLIKTKVQGKDVSVIFSLCNESDLEYVSGSLIFKEKI